MPGNIVSINDYSKLTWYVGDSQMEKLIAVLDEIGFRQKAKVVMIDEEEIDPETEATSDASS